MSDSSKSSEKRKRKYSTSRLVLSDFGTPSDVMSRIYEHILSAAKRDPAGKAGAPVDIVIRTKVDPKAEQSMRRLIRTFRHGTRDKIQGKTTVEPIGDDELLEESPLDCALNAARVRGQFHAAEILSRDDMLTSKNFAAAVGVTRATVNSWRQAGRALGLCGAKRGYRYPVWQIDNSGAPFEALPQLHRILGSAWAVYRFLVQAHPELDGATGLAVLVRGEPMRAVEAADSVVQGFA